MAPVGVGFGLYQLTHIRPPQAARCQEVQQLGHAIRMHDKHGGQDCTWALCLGGVLTWCAAAVDVGRPPT